MALPRGGKRQRAALGGGGVEHPKREHRPGKVVQNLKKDANHWGRGGEKKK